MALCYERNVGPWQLGFRAALGLLAFVVTLILCGAAAALAHLFYVIGRLGLPPATLARFLMHLGTIIFTGFGVGSYIYVSSKAPRPVVLHAYGLMLVLQLVHSSARPLLFLCQLKSSLARALLLVIMNVLWAANRAFFCKVVTEKLMVLGLPASRCRTVKPWGKALMAAILTCGLCGGAFWALVASNLLQGVPYDDALAAPSFFPRPADGDASDHEVSVAGRIAFSVVLNLGGVSSGVVLVAASLYIFIARRLMRGVVAALAVRGTPLEILRKVRGTLRQHMLGILLSLSTTMLVILAAIVNAPNLLGGSEAEELVSLAVNALDAVGDVAGILFLSGIGALLVHEDPKAGDINRCIRSLLHAAVLSGRASFVFEGQVIATANRRCIVSFPGKFFEEWKDMTWHCQRHELSTACVFLPESDPHKRFGEHSECPDTPGACWCTSLYGVEKPWGCSWFPVWEANVRRAVELGLELVVVFYPGQVGQGLVAWDSLAHVDLWDGRGLGGSQKGEAAYLLSRGISFTSEDLDAVRSWLASNV